MRVDDFLRHHAELINMRNWGSDEGPVTVRTHYDSYLLPNQLVRGSPKWWLRRRQGVLAADGSLILDAMDKRGTTSRGEDPTSIGVRKVWWPAEDVSIPKSGGARLYRAAYGGTIYPHFGHFLLDSLARLYPLLPMLKADPSIPVVFHRPDYKEIEQPLERGYMQQIFDLLGLDRERIIFISNNIYVEVLYLAKSLFQDRILCSSHLAPAMAEGARGRLPKTERSEKVAFISRSRLANGTNNAGNALKLDWSAP